MPDPQITMSRAKPETVYSPVKTTTKRTTTHPPKAPPQDWASRVPDGGWGWMVVGGSVITAMLMPLLSQGFGVIFSRYLLQEGSSSTTNAWLFNVHSCIWNMMGVMVRPLSQAFGWRCVANGGVLLTFLGLVISAFTPSPLFLLFSFSLLTGVGGGLVICMSFIIVPSYFERRRGMANAIMMSGVCTGQMIGPPLLRYLQDEYGYRGATLILAAILLNACVGTAFFHPVEWHLKDTQTTQVTLEPNSRKGDDCDSDESERTNLTNEPTDTDKEPTINQEEHASTNHIPGASTTSVHVRQRTGLLVIVKGVMRSTLSDLTILRSPRALIIAVGSTLFLNGSYNFLMMVPFKMQTAGHTLGDAAYCLSASAFANLLMRIVSSALSDYSWFNMRLAYMSGLFMCATGIVVFPFLDSVEWMMRTMLVWGGGFGMAMSFFNLIMVEFMGLEKLAPTYGGVSFILGIGFLTIGPLTGLIRDACQSYTVTMWVLSGYVYLSFILWVFMPAAQTYDRRRTEALNADVL